MLYSIAIFSFQIAVLRMEGILHSCKFAEFYNTSFIGVGSKIIYIDMQAGRNLLPKLLVADN